MTMTDTTTTTGFHHETPEQLQRLAYQLHYNDGLPWDAVADQFDEPKAIVQDLAQAYIDRTDTAAREAQIELF